MFPLVTFYKFVQIRKQNALLFSAFAIYTKKRTFTKIYSNDLQIANLR
jgi:hypothetical protein